jgi:hypothetical protein
MIDNRPWGTSLERNQFSASPVQYTPFGREFRVAPNCRKNRAEVAVDPRDIVFRDGFTGEIFPDEWRKREMLAQSDPHNNAQNLADYRIALFGRARIIWERKIQIGGCWTRNCETRGWLEYGSRKFIESFSRGSPGVNPSLTDE